MWLQCMIDERYTYRIDMLVQIGSGVAASKSDGLTLFQDPFATQC